MALVHTESGPLEQETGELVVLLTKDEAANITAKIKGHVSQAWRLLAEAHHRRADLALGYVSWEQYVRAEFDMGRSRSYQILDQAAVIAEIESAVVSVAPSELVSTDVDTVVAEVVTEAAARDVKPLLNDVTSAIKEKVTAEATVEPARVKEIVTEVVDQFREKAQQESDDRKAMADLNAAGEKAGMDLDKDRLGERGDWSTWCRNIGDRTPRPAEFIERHREYLNERHIGQAMRAHGWLGEFLDRWNEEAK